MKRIKRIIAFALAMSAMTAALSACEKSGGTDGTEVSESAAQTEPAKETIKAIYDEIRTEFNTNLDLSDYPLAASDVPSDFEAVYEAEEAELGGSAAVTAASEASGGSAVTGINKGVDGTGITFNVEIEYAGFYDLNFISKGGDDQKRENYVLLDGEEIGTVYRAGSDSYSDSYLKNVYLSAGSHKISVTPYWGFIDYDCLKLTATTITEDIYNVTAELSNPNADDNTKRLYKFLCDIYGKYSLTGQYADNGRTSTEYSRIYKQTGSHFAVLGMDMMYYDSASISKGSDSNTVEFAYDWYANGGGIVTLVWHWHTPDDYQVNNESNPWYSSFYKQGSNLDLDKIMNGEDEAGYELLMNDIGLISEQLERLRDSGVPVLWRPLHEASGGWFWWGDCEPESYIKLWNTMYDKMTNEHNLTNLIWVWNGQDPAWYPGDETVDIVSYDIYAGNHVDSCYSGTFAATAEIPTETKLVALSENGCVMDPDKVMNGNSRWLYWGTWSDPFTIKNGVLNEEYTSLEILDKAYQSERTLTLEELPDLKNYPLE